MIQTYMKDSMKMADTDAKTTGEEQYRWSHGTVNEMW